jgi:GNAT superfamily N-acetyltransferase
VELPLSQAPYSPEFRLRHATEADHLRLARLVDEWWGERRPRLPRLWLRHFALLSWIAERSDGRPIGLGVGFISIDHVGLGIVHLVAVAPSSRRRGVGRAIADAIEHSLIRQGAERVEATVWPGNRVGVTFLEALGYTPSPDAPDRLYGVPATTDFDGEGEDRAVFVRRLVAR